MRGLPLAFAVSGILWCLLAWCAVCIGTLAGSSILSASVLDLVASLACIGLALAVACTWVTSFYADESTDTAPVPGARVR